MDMATVVPAEMAAYLRHLAERVEKHARAVPKEKLFAKPFAFGNSVGHLLLHLAGNLNHYIGAGIAGTGYVRNRPLEFTDPSPPSAEETLAKFRAAVEMVLATLAEQGPDDWGKPIADNPPIRTRYGMFLVCVAHVNNHIGQMAYLVQAMGLSTQEPPVW